MANQVIELDDNGVETGKTGIESAMSYHELNAMINLWDKDGKMQLAKDKLAVRKYFLDHVNQNTVFLPLSEGALWTTWLRMSTTKKRFWTSTASSSLKN